MSRTKYAKYYDLVKQQAEIYDQKQNLRVGTTWEYHLLPVIKNALMLAKHYHADRDVVEVAAIFHDYADLLDMANREQHHLLGAALAGRILQQDGFDSVFIDKVADCIINHRASVVRAKFSPEEICVADADAVSHLDNVVELLCWRASQGGSVTACNNFVKTKINKSYAKMSPETQALMRDKYENIMKILY